MPIGWSSLLVVFVNLLLTCDESNDDDALEDDVLDVGENDADTLQEEVEHLWLELRRLAVLSLVAAVQREAQVQLQVRACVDTETSQYVRIFHLVTIRGVTLCM